MNGDEYEAHIQAIVDAAPLLRPEQIAALSALFDWQPALFATVQGGAA